MAVKEIASQDLDIFQIAFKMAHLYLLMDHYGAGDYHTVSIRLRNTKMAHFFPFNKNNRPFWIFLTESRQFDSFQNGPF